MIDIDKELGLLKEQKYKPSEELRLNTRAKVNSAARQSGQKEVKGFRPVYLTTVAAVLAIVLFISVFTATPAQAAGYYTIDINPSVSVAVDANDIVMSVTPENEDAKELLSALDLKGMQFERALSAIVQAAVEQQYLTGDGHLLVAHFGGDERLTQQQLDSIVNEQIPGGSVSALVLNGEKQEFENAEKSGRKAGIELLLSNAKEKGIKDENIGSLIHALSAQDNTGKDKPKDNGGANKNDQAPSSQPTANGNPDNNGKNDKDPQVSSGSNGNNNNGNSSGDKGNQGKDKDNKGSNDPDKDNKGNNNNSQNDGRVEGKDKENGSQGDKQNGNDNQGGSGKDGGNIKGNNK